MTAANIVVLKFGSSVLRNPGDLHVAVDEIYRRWRGGCRVLAVVSAFEGITDELMAEVTDVLGAVCPEATASYVATGEQRTAAFVLAIGWAVFPILGFGSDKVATPKEAVSKIREAQASGYPLLHKPLSHARLRAAVTTLLRQARSQVVETGAASA